MRTGSVQRTMIPAHLSKGACANLKNFSSLATSWILLLAAGMIFAGAPLKPARAQQAASPATAHADTSAYVPHKLKIPGVRNAGESTPELLRGAQPTEEGFASLAKLGVQIVVDLRKGDRQSEREEVTRLGMKYVSIPWYCMRPDDAVVAEFLELLQKNPGGKVFVHCREGIDRTGMLIAAYRMTAEGRTAAQAMAEMRTYGFSFTHHLTCPGLAGYEESFPTTFASHPAFQKLRVATPPLPRPSPDQR